MFEYTDENEYSLHLCNIILMQNSEEASMVELDTYIEGLYDDLAAKTKSTGLILQLARLPENLIELANNGESSKTFYL